VVGRHVLNVSLTDGRNEVYREFELEVIEVDTFPVARIVSFDTSYWSDENVELDGSESYDEDGDHLTYLWTSDISGPIGSDDHLYEELKPGTHTITLTVTDEDGDQNTTSVKVKVKDVKDRETAKWARIIILFLLIGLVPAMITIAGAIVLTRSLTRKGQERPYDTRPHEAPDPSIHPKEVEGPPAPTLPKPPDGTGQ
jgi:hypothetical protein